MRYEGTRQNLKRDRQWPPWPQPTVKFEACCQLTSNLVRRGILCHISDTSMVHHLYVSSRGVSCSHSWKKPWRGKQMIRQIRKLTTHPQNPQSSSICHKIHTNNSDTYQLQSLHLKWVLGDLVGCLRKRNWKSGYAIPVVILSITWNHLDVVSFIKLHWTVDPQLNSSFVFLSLIGPIFSVLLTFLHKYLHHMVPCLAIKSRLFNILNLISSKKVSKPH